MTGVEEAVFETDATASATGFQHLFHPRRPIDYDGTVTIEPTREGARLTITGHARPKGWWRLMQPFMSGELKRGVRSELAQIKAIVERQA